jgi:hypothetical protein
MYLNKNNLIKYFLQLIIVSISSYSLSPCNIEVSLSLLIGLISASIFAILDIYYPIIINKSE